MCRWQCQSFEQRRERFQKNFKLTTFFHHLDKTQIEGASHARISRVFLSRSVPKKKKGGPEADRCKAPDCIRASVVFLFIIRVRFSLPAYTPRPRETESEQRGKLKLDDLIDVYLVPKREIREKTREKNFVHRIFISKKETTLCHKTNWNLADCRRQSRESCKLFRIKLL